MLALKNYNVSMPGHKKMGRKVVIIDDRDEQRFILSKFLKIAGHKVIGEGENGKEAVALAKKLKPDLMIMDVKMPEMDGIEAAKEINSTSPVPIVLFTAKNDPGTIDKAKDAGVMAYLVKPIEEKEINPTIELAISSFQEFQALRQENLNLKETIKAGKIIEKAKGLLMGMENISEKKAFRRIQKISMDRRKAMKEIAEAILMTYGEKEK